MPVCFLREKPRRDVDLGGRGGGDDLGGVTGERTLTGVYHMKKKSIFNYKKENNKVNNVFN